MKLIRLISNLFFFRLFQETDRDANKCLTLAELENLILEMQSGKVDVDKDYAISKILNSFDRNNDKIIQEGEFVEGCKKWIEEATQLAQSDDSNSKRILRKASELLLIVRFNSY